MPIAIVGMHRSGTSMVTRLLNLCGLDLGPEADLMPPIEADNSEGYWENVNFVWINDEILRLRKADAYHPPQYTPTWKQNVDLAQVTSYANDLIAELSSAAVWGWKDPRTTLTLDFWQSLIPDLKIIMCLRHPTEVAQSLARRHSLDSIDVTLKLWWDYNQMIFHLFPRERFLLTHYNSYFQNPIAELRRLTDFIGLSTSDDQITTAIQSILGQVRHNKAAITDASQLPQDILNLYNLLCQYAGPNYSNLHLAA
jgi:hypothetical protein